MSKKKVTMVASEMESENVEEMGEENSRKIKSEMKEKHVGDTTSTSADAAELEAGQEEEVGKSAAKKYRFIRESSFHNLGNDYDLDASIFLTERVGPVPPESTYSTRSAHDQSNSAHGFFCREICEKQ